MLESRVGSHQVLLAIADDDCSRDKPSRACPRSLVDQSAANSRLTSVADHPPPLRGLWLSNLLAFLNSGAVAYIIIELGDALLPFDPHGEVRWGGFASNHRLLSGAGLEMRTTLEALGKLQSPLSS
jgi:hypothetical protein